MNFKALSRTAAHCACLAALFSLQGCLYLLGSPQLKGAGAAVTKGVDSFFDIFYDISPRPPQEFAAAVNGYIDAFKSNPTAIINFTHPEYRDRDSRTQANLSAAALQINRIFSIRNPDSVRNVYWECSAEDCLARFDIFWRLVTQAEGIELLLAARHVELRAKKMPDGAYLLIEDAGPDRPLPLPDITGEIVSIQLSGGDNAAIGASGLVQQSGGGGGGGGGGCTGDGCACAADADCGTSTNNRCGAGICF